MRKMFLPYFFAFATILLINSTISAQTSVYWRIDGPSSGNWHHGLTCESSGDGQWYYNSWGGFRQKPDCFGANDVYFDGNGLNTMNLNGGSDYTVRTIYFTLNATVSRILNTSDGRTLYLSNRSSLDPKIENNSSATHTFNVPIILNNYAELNPVSGDLVFSGTINNNGQNINIYGENSKMITFSGAISGTGKLILNQYSKVKLSTIHAYTGNTEINKGELWIETSGDAIASGSAIYLGNGGQMSNIAKIFLSKLDGGATFSRTININDGNASTRFLGGVNTSGINTFSSSIALTSSKPLNLEAVSSTGIVEFSGVISGDGAVTTLGSGTIKFSNANTYTGTTSVTAGTLELSANLASSQVNLTGGAILSISGTNVTINDLTIGPGCMVKVQAGKSLTVNGALNNAAGPTGIVVESTGSIITIGSVSGSATIKRDITSDFKWHFLSAPVSGQSICDGNFAPTTGNFNATTGATFDFYRYSEPLQPSNLNWLNLKGDGYTLNTADFGATPIFGVGTGYLVAYSSSFAGSSTKAFAGPLTTGDQTIVLTHGGTTWNLIGNPFASAIDWDLVTDRSNLAEGYYQVYNENKAGGAGYEYYLDGAHKTTGATDKISAMQGFFVKALGSSLVLPNTARVHDNHWLKTTQSQSTPVDQLNIKLSNSNNYDEALLIFEAQGTTGLDFFDAEKMFSLSSENPQVYSINSDGNNIAINSMPYNSDSFSIPLGTFIPTDGNFTLELTGIETFTSTPVIVLQDLKLNTVQDINANPVYEFAASATDNPNRFVLNFNAVTVGTTEPSLPEALRIYANAGNIYLSGATGKADVYVRNMIGQTVIQRSVNGDALKVINAENLTAGVYIVSVVNSAQTISTKVVIK
ncbi:MAG: T9SS type A sorting domain-containing protein [Paludibacter sp.]